jgi:AraC family transcriptional regulator, activator of mtrCDE
VPHPIGADAALDRIFSATDVQIDAFAVCEVAADAEIAIPRIDQIEIHYVVQGTLFLRIEDQVSVTLGQGSVVVVPPQLAQRLAGSEQPRHRYAARDICSTRQDGLQHYDGTGFLPASVQILCGQISVEHKSSFPLFANLRHPVAADLSDQPLAMSAMVSMRDEIDGAGIFSRSLTGSLMKTCLVLLIRRHLAEHGAMALPGLFYRPWLAQAVAAICEEPAARHTVASLAAKAGRGRAGFAKEFGAILGMPPMEFVFEVRLRHARSLLVTTTESIADIAAKAGFASRSHFSRLFRAAYGLDPTSYRRNEDARNNS